LLELATLNATASSYQRTNVVVVVVEVVVDMPFNRSYIDRW
jgi:hypothetical protein